MRIRWCVSDRRLSPLSHMLAVSVRERERGMKGPKISVPILFECQKSQTGSGQPKVRKEGRSMFLHALNREKGEKTACNVGRHRQIRVRAVCVSLCAPRPVTLKQKIWTDCVESERTYILLTYSCPKGLTKESLSLSPHECRSLQPYCKSQSLK